MKQKGNNGNDDDDDDHNMEEIMILCVYTPG